MKKGEKIKCIFCTFAPFWLYRVNVETIEIKISISKISNNCMLSLSEYLRKNEKHNVIALFLTLWR